jgi:pimeloyl-ACP methyl ester carboxylesterase
MHKQESHHMPHNESAAPRWRARTIETQAFALIEQEAGAQSGETPPVLCLGFDDPAASRTLDDLAQSFRLIALTPAAVLLGASEQLDAQAFAREAVACADRLGLKRFSVLARGDEDHAALCLGLLAGERVTAIALIAPDLHSRDGAAQDAQLMEQLSQVRTPVLAVFGALERIATPHTARLWRERLPAYHILVLRDASAQVDCERPHALARAAGAFLRAPNAFKIERDKEWRDADWRYLLN